MNFDLVTIKECPIYPKLFVSKDGRIFRFKGNFLVQIKTGKYRYEKAGYRIGGSDVTVLVHRAVASAFCQNYSPEKVVNHKDFNTYNNNYENLEWVTQAENIKHRDDNNRTSKGENHYRSKFSHKEIDTIRGDNRSCRKIAEDFSVSHSTIARIKNGATWKR